VLVAGGLAYVPGVVGGVPSIGIEIIGNAGFSANANSGNGSTDNPWVVEHRTLSGGSAYILVRDTTDHFVVRECSMTSTIAPVNSPLSLDYSSSGIILDNVTNGKVENNNTFSFKNGAGIYVVDSDNCTIANNTVNDNQLNGIMILRTNDTVVNNNTVSHNNLSNNTSGIGLSSSINITVEGNYVDHNPEYGVRLTNSANCTLVSNILMYNCGGNAGLFIENSDYNDFIANTISNGTGIGVRFLSGQHNYFEKNTINGNAMEGVFCDDDNNEWNDNEISFNRGGILFAGGDSNWVVRNRISSNRIYGILLTPGNNNVIIENDFLMNTDFGVNISASSGNQVYHNNFIGNRNSDMQGWDNQWASNSWDDGYPSGGNYWNDGASDDRKSGPGQNIAGADGICDNEYQLDGGSGWSDWYPMVDPIASLAGAATVEITSHEDGDYVSGIISIKTKVATNATYYEDAGIMYYVDGAIVGFEPTGYTFDIDTTAYAEDSTIVVKAEVMFLSNPPMSDTVSLIVNNVVETGAFISASTLQPEYSPDESATLMVDVINSPPAYSKMRIEVNYTDPNGNVFNSSLIRNFAVPTYNLAINLRSDAVLGTYGVAVCAYGMIGAVNIWTATTTTTFDVVGKNLHDAMADLQSGIDWANYSIGMLQDDMDYLNASTASSFAGLSTQLTGVNVSLSKSISGMNATFLAKLQKVNLSLAANIQSALVSITSDISGMNSTFLAELANVNSSLAADIQAAQDSLASDIAGVNATLISEIAKTNASLAADIQDAIAAITGEIDGMNMTFLAELAKVNASLAAEIQAALATITGDVAGMNLSITAKLNGMIANDTATQAWLSGVLAVLSNDLHQTNSTLHARIAALSASTAAQFAALNADLDVVVADLTALDVKLTAHDGKLTKHNATVMAAMADISDLVESSNLMTLDALKLRITNLAANLSTVDAELGADLTAIVGDIGAFQNDTDAKLAGISTTLTEMDKLDTILTDLAGLDADIQTAQTQLGDKVDSSSKDQAGKMDAQTMMLYVLIALVVISLLVNIVMRPKSSASSGARKPSKGKAGEDDEGDGGDAEDNK